MHEFILRCQWYSIEIIRLRTIPLQSSDSFQRLRFVITNAARTKNDSTSKCHLRIKKQKPSHYKPYFHDIRAISSDVGDDEVCYSGQKDRNKLPWCVIIRCFKDPIIKLIMDSIFYRNVCNLRICIMSYGHSITESRVPKHRNYWAYIWAQQRIKLVPITITLGFLGWTSFLYSMLQRSLMHISISKWKLECQGKPYNNDSSKFQNSLPTPKN